jgi:hypothetical protein
VEGGGIWGRVARTTESPESAKSLQCSHLESAFTFACAVICGR